MSNFDNTFVFDSVKEYLSGRIVSLNAEISNIQNELSIVSNLGPQYTNLVPIRHDYLTRKVGYHQTSIGRLGNVIAEIEVVENLDNNSKSSLYTFYDLYLKPNNMEPKRDFMRRMVYNSETLLTQVNTLLQDSNITPQSAYQVTKLICLENPIREETASLLYHLQEN